MFLLMSANYKRAIELTNARNTNPDRTLQPSLNEILAWTAWGFQFGKFTDLSYNGKLPDASAKEASIARIKELINNNLVVKALDNGYQEGLKQRTSNKGI